MQERDKLFLSNKAWALEKLQEDGSYFSELAKGSLVNIEIESQSQIIVDTVERLMAERYPAEAK